MAEAQENSIEIYDDSIGRHTVLTRSARMRKFRFYQYKPVSESPGTPKLPSHTVSQISPIGQNDTSSQECDNDEDDNTGAPILSTRDGVIHGKVPLVPEQYSQEIHELDNKIAQIEKRISDLNRDDGSADNLAEIFNLVNTKNDLIRRQTQLNIIEKERKLEKANEELTKELRSLMSIDDSKKTKAQLERQKYLYNESLALVNKRNELVHYMDVQERGIEEDNRLKSNLKTFISESTTGRKLTPASQDQNCVIQ